MSHSSLVVVRRNGRRSSLEVQHRNTVSEVGAQPRNTGAELEKLYRPAGVVIYATVIPPLATGGKHYVLVTGQTRLTIIRNAERTLFDAVSLTEIRDSSKSNEY